MRTTRTSCLRGRRGTSTVLGTLVFIGILFTSVIPMYLVMRQADTLYDKKLFEMKSLDDERVREDLDVYVFPSGQFSDSLNVTVCNRCELVVKVARVWVNDTFVEINTTVSPMSEVDLNPITVGTQVNSSYDLRVVTERGNVFIPETGTLYYSENGWEAECLAICVSISSSGVHFKVRIEKDSQTIYEEEVHKMGGSVGGAVVETYDVTGSGPGEYRATVMKAKGSGWEIIHEENVAIDWPSGPPVVWVYA